MNLLAVFGIAGGGIWWLSTTSWLAYVATFLLGSLFALLVYCMIGQLKRRPKIDPSSNLAIHLSNASKAIWGIPDDDFSLSWRADVCERLNEFSKCRSIDSAQRAISSVGRFIKAKPQVFEQQAWVSGLKKLAEDAGFKTDGFPS